MAKSAKWVKVRDRVKKGRKTGVVLANRSTGEERVLLNPHGKYQKYSVELEKGLQLTNTGDVKKDKNGKKVELSGGQRAYRAGYRSAIIDQTKAYKGGTK